MPDQYLTLTRSERHFVHALLSLMEEKDFREITVMELAERAEYDRKTYYRHFKSKEDILLLYCYHILYEMADAMRAVPLTVSNTILAYFRFWEKHRAFLSLLAKNDLLHHLGNLQEELLYDHVGQIVQPGIPVSLAEAPPLSRYSFYYTAGALWTVLCHWVLEDPKATPEELTEYYKQTTTGLAAFLATETGPEEGPLKERREEE